MIFQLVWSENRLICSIQFNDLAIFYQIDVRTHTKKCTYPPTPPSAVQSNLSDANSKKIIVNIDETASEVKISPQLWTIWHHEISYGCKLLGNAFGQLHYFYYETSLCVLKISTKWHNNVDIDFSLDPTIKAIWHCFESDTDGQWMKAKRKSLAINKNTW